jgi:hypothetical protein
MKLDRQPASRRSIIPWYDSEAVCLVTIILMFFVFIFGFSGLTLTLEMPANAQYAWIPILLMVASGIIIVSTTIRLIKRYAVRRFQ